MSSRPTRESGGGVLSFTFLDVLTCTMGSLVLLVVILGQKAAHTRLEDALRNGPRKGSPGPTADTSTADSTASAPLPTDAPSAAEVAAKLAELRKQEAELAKLRAKAAERLNEEQARVSHLEEHERRLEHELGQLHVTLARLEEAEKQHTVDQETAERDLERLKQLVVDTEEQLKNLRSEPGEKKSYAIVPYKGANGTYRRPVYIECTKDAVTIQPEGIQLTAMDFDGPIRSGNPLAAAVRAAREELNARAKAAGATDLPDPYPLLIVRPDGARAYSAALSAISSWDADYGYEFVDADWELEYPYPDPQLSQVMVHAVDLARSRQAMLAKVAPRRYGSRLAGGGRSGNGGGGGGAAGDGGGAGGDGESGGGFETIAESSGAADRIGERAGDGFLSSGGESFGGGGRGGVSLGSASASGTGAGGSGGTGGSSGGGRSSGGNFADQFSPPNGDGGSQSAASGEAVGDGSAGGGSMNSKTAEIGGAAAGAAGAAGASAAGGQPGGMMANGASHGGAAGGTATAGSSSGGSMANAASAGAAAGASGQSGATSAQASGIVSMNGNQGSGRGKENARSAAETRGANWANAEASRRASPITRPIQVVVRPEQLDVLPMQETGVAAGAKATAVSFQQPTEKVLDELATVVQQQIKDWGLAGQGMYWRPTLVLQVAPGADQHAARLNDLLQDSGIDVRVQQVATRRSGEAGDARR